jgi:hypothetical protein
MSIEERLQALEEALWSERKGATDGEHRQAPGEPRERLIGSPDESSEHRRTVLRDILDVFARLKSSRAVHYRGGVRIEPEDIPVKFLGSGNTAEQMWELTDRRVLERIAETTEGGSSWGA